MSIHLRRTQENRDEIATATAQLGRRTGLDGVLAHLDRQARHVRVPGSAVEWGFRWEDRDVTNRRWWPQGITTSADAGASDEGQRLVVVSWYAQKVGSSQHGSRITVVDLATLTYRHVLLVQPVVDERGRARFRPVTVHAGGLVWWGPYLHVAGTRRGLVSCRLEDLVRVDDLTTSLGYRYVLPVCFAYRAGTDEGTEQMRYSFCSLDRASDPPELLAGEYATGTMTRRIAHFPLDPDTHLLSTDDAGTTSPLRVHDDGLGHMQGAALVGDTYYVTSSNGKWRRGTLHVGRPGEWRSLDGALPVGPEDISYWPELDLLWSVTEHPGRRFVFAVRRSSLDG